MCFSFITVRLIETTIQKQEHVIVNTIIIIRQLSAEK
jgi:hypothetical protein